jgi:hypothetical protein
VTYYKVLTHDFRPPLQGGEPIWDGVTLPFTLPQVALDTTDDECAAGWNCCACLLDALKLTGFWRSGRPVVPLVVEPSPDLVTRGTKSRASQLTIVRRATGAEIADAITDFSAVFGEHAAVMAAEQIAWYEALGRPLHDEAAVEAGLRAALAARGLGDWRLERHADAGAAWAARAAWAATDAWADRAAWAATDAWDAGAARSAWAAMDAMAAWAVWDATDAWAARAAWADRAARAALVVKLTALRKWIDCPPDRDTIGIREAYRHGLAVAIPTAMGVLGWAMDPAPVADDSQ